MPTNDPFSRTLRSLFAEIERIKSNKGFFGNLEVKIDDREKGKISVLICGDGYIPDEPTKTHSLIAEFLDPVFMINTTVSVARRYMEQGFVVDCMSPQLHARPWYRRDETGRISGSLGMNIEFIFTFELCFPEGNRG